MNLPELTKEQKQYIILGLVGLVLVAGLAWFGIRHSLSSVSTARVELLDLKDKIARADSVLSKSDQTSADYDYTVNVLREYLDNIPPERNYYSWATEVIYLTGRSAGMDIESVDEVAKSVPKGAQGKKDLSFDAYSLRIRAHGGYANIKHFLRQITAEHPLVRVTGLEISSGKSPDAHDVHLYVQWPFHLEEVTQLWEEIAEKQKDIARLTLKNHKSASAAPNAGPTGSDEDRASGPDADSLQQQNLNLIASRKPANQEIGRRL